MQRVASAGPVLNSLAGAFAQQNRNMATLKHIQMRLKSVKNIQKITQSMKMVSAAKYARAERDLKGARPFGIGSAIFYEQAEISPPAAEPKELLIAMTSDRGLCGAVHTGVARHIRNDLIARDNPPDSRIFCVGDKSRAVLQRTHGNRFIVSANEIGRIPPTFLDASRVAIEVLNSGFEYTHGSIVYNKFKTVVSYQCSTLPIFSTKTVEAAEKLVAYDSLDSEVLQETWNIHWLRSSFTP